MNAEDKAFLKRYIAQEGWLADPTEDASGIPGAMEADVSDGEDERYLEAADAFESRYNFRFEEPNAARIESYPRVIDSSVRKVESKRKRQRAAKAERAAKAKEAGAMEVKRLKNLKKAELSDQMARIRKVAGLSSSSNVDLDALDLEGDFDAATFDRQVAKLFGGGYYDAHDDGVDLAATGDADLDAFLGEGKPAGVGEGAGEGVGEGEAARRMLAEASAQVKRSLDEYYKLDYEDKIGDMKTRFKYRSVLPNKFGMDANTILGTEDKELNAVVPIKKIAAYRDREWQVKRRRDRKEGEGRGAGRGEEEDGRRKKKARGHGREGGGLGSDAAPTAKQERLQSFIPPRPGGKKENAPEAVPQLYYNKGAKKRAKRAAKRKRNKQAEASS